LYIVHTNVVLLLTPKIAMQNFKALIHNIMNIYVISNSNNHLAYAKTDTKQVGLKNKINGFKT